MKVHEVKTNIIGLSELGESYGDLMISLKGTIDEVKRTKKLWRTGNRSKIIELGVALIVFPEPTPISETIGACFVAAGMIQKGVQSRSIYVEDRKNLPEYCERSALTQARYLNGAPSDTVKVM